MKDGQWVKEGRFITAGQFFQLSDGASASLIMEANIAKSAAFALRLLSRYLSGGLSVGRDGNRAGICVVPKF